MSRNSDNPFQESNIDQVLSQIDLIRTHRPYKENINSYRFDLLYRRADQLLRGRYRDEWFEDYKVTGWGEPRKVHNCPT